MTLSHLTFLIPILLLMIFYLFKNNQNHRQSALALNLAVVEGLSEPTSLHPIIDQNKCIGCKSCVYACPQQLGHNVLGIYHGKAELLEAANCIGHGACKAVCPVNAISLVFGTENRGVDIPQVNQHFETNVPGIYIAGELGGMGLIRNAIEQGKIATQSLSKGLSKTGKHEYQLIIIGAGPAGISASLQAKALGLNYLTIDQDSFGGTVFKYPRGKIVMTQPVDLPIVGKMHFKETSKEELLQFWQNIQTDVGINSRFLETVIEINKLDSGFSLLTNRSRISTDKILLAIGRRGTPRRLGVEGEDLAKVVYQLIDPDQYAGQKVLIVGGGDSALEAALAIADIRTTEVSVSYRNSTFARAKAKNRNRIEEYVSESRIRLFLSSEVIRISKDIVELTQRDQVFEIANTAVIINVGGVLPTGFLRETGITIDTKFGSL